MRALTSRPRLLLLIAPLLGILFLAALAIWLWGKRPRISEAEVRETVYSTILREAPASFLVTGYIDVVGTAQVSDRRVLLPGVLGLNLGTNRATVRLPARVSYGFDVARLRPGMIRLHADTLIEVTIPDLSVYSVAPNLRAMEVETDRGWARVDADGVSRLERRALRNVEASLHAQGLQHVRSSVQPRVNTARALEQMLRPALQAAGVREAKLKFVIGEGITSEVER